LHKKTEKVDVKAVFFKIYYIKLSTHHEMLEAELEERIKKIREKINKHKT